MRQTTEPSMMIDDSSEENCDEYDGSDSMTEESELPQPMSADLTPSTNNRLNEIFGFDAATAAAGQHGSLSTPNFKRKSSGGGGASHGSVGFHSSAQQVIEDDEVFAKGVMVNPASQSNGSNHHSSHRHLSVKNSTAGSTLVTTDANNNTITVEDNNNHHGHNNNGGGVSNNNNNITSGSNGGCWSMHHTVSTNSLGNKSEQPTDQYDYLLPSPCTNEHGHTFSTFYGSSMVYGTSGRRNSSARAACGSAGMVVNGGAGNPPHSAGLIGNVTNEEYFLTQANYVNHQKIAKHSAMKSLHGAASNTITASTATNANMGHMETTLARQARLSASNGNIPHSLV